MSRTTCASLAALTMAVLAGAQGAGQPADLSRFEAAWATSRGDGVAVAVVALDPALGQHVAVVVGSDAPGATVEVAPAASEADLGAVVGGVAADVVVLALGEASLGDRFLADGDLTTAIAAATAGGVVVIAGAGSEAEALGPPPAEVGAVVVGAVTAAGQPRPFANRTLRRSLGAAETGAVADALDGTSVAAGHVGAAAALLLAQGRDPEAIAGILVATAANPLGDARLGAGYLDAAAAVATPGGGPVFPSAAGAAAPVAEAEAPAAHPAPTDIGPPATAAVPTDGPLALAVLVAVAALLGNLVLGRVAWHRRRWERRWPG